MILTIIGLPSHFSYYDIKAMIKRETHITNFVLDNLSMDSSGRKTVTVGLADGSEGPILTSRLNGFPMAGQSLSVFPHEDAWEPTQQFENKSQAGWYSAGGLQTPRNREFNNKTETRYTHEIPQRSHSPPRGAYPATSNMEYPSRNYGNGTSSRPPFQGDQAPSSRRFPSAPYPSDVQQPARQNSRWDIAPVQDQYRAQSFDSPAAPFTRDRSPYSGESHDRRRSRSPPRGGDRGGNNIAGGWRRGQSQGQRVSPQRNQSPWQDSRRSSPSPPRGRRPSPKPAPWARSSAPKAVSRETSLAVGPARPPLLREGPPNWSELPLKDCIPSRYASTSPTRGVRGSNSRPYSSHPSARSSRQEDSDPYFSNRGGVSREIEHKHEVRGGVDFPSRDRADDFGRYRAGDEIVTGEKEMHDFRSRDFESQVGQRGYSVRDGEHHFGSQYYERDLEQRQDVGPHPSDFRTGPPDFHIRAERAQNNSLPVVIPREFGRPAVVDLRPERYGTCAPPGPFSPDRRDFRREAEGEWIDRRNTSEIYPQIDRNNGQPFEKRDCFVDKPQPPALDEIKQREMAIRDQWVRWSSQKMLTEFKPTIEPNSQLYIDVERELKKELLDRIDRYFGVEYGHTFNEIGNSYRAHHKGLMDWDLMQKLTAKYSSEHDIRKRQAEVAVLPPAKKPREVEPTPLPVQRVVPVAVLPPAKKPQEVEPTPLPVQRNVPVAAAANPRTPQIITAPVPRVQLTSKKSMNASGGDDLVPTKSDALLFSRAVSSILATDMAKRLYIIKPDFSIILDKEGDLIKRFFLDEVLKATSDKNFTPSFVIVGLQKDNMFEVWAENEKSRQWMLKHNMKTFKAFPLSVYTFEELTYERATIWLPGHTNIPLKPFEKLCRQNRHMEGLALEKWKFVKATTSPDGTRIFVDIDESSSTALTHHNMELNYELEKVYVVLKCMSTDRGEFDAVFHQKSVPIPGKKPVMHVPSLHTKLTKNSIRISVEDQKMTIETAVSLKLKIIKKLYKYISSKNANISFSNHGLLTEPPFLVVNPENVETSLWLLSLDLGKVHGNKKVIVEKGLFLPKTVRVGLLLPGEVGQYGPSVLQKFNSSNIIVGVDFTKWRLVAQMVNKEVTGSKLAIDVDFDSMVALKTMKYTLKYENKTVVLKHNQHGLLSSVEETEAVTDHHDVTDMELDSDTENVSPSDTGLLEKSSAKIQEDTTKEELASKKEQNGENIANEDKDDDVMICESGQLEVVTIDSDDDDDEIARMKKELEGMYTSINNEIAKRQKKDPVGRDVTLRSKYKSRIDVAEWKYEGKFSTMSDDYLQYYHDRITELRVSNESVSAKRFHELTSVLEGVKNKKKYF